jgi:hypothetical protein
MIKMGAIIFAFLYKYFFAIILTYVVGMFSKALIKDFGNDRATKIKETILSAMLWAEEQFGIGNGTQKWEEAWKKIRELLAVQGITLSTSEIPVVETLMKANVPQINAITYSALPEADLQVRKIKNRTPEAILLIEELKKKYTDQPPVEVN